MADLGTIGTYTGLGTRTVGTTPPASTTIVSSQLNYVRAIQSYRSSLAMSEWGSIDASGTLTGYVTENGDPVPYCVVNCYWRDTGVLVARTYADADGMFQFLLLDPNVNKYFVVALDPDGGTQYNAQIYDRLAPV